MPDYGNAPIALGEVRLDNWDEYMHYLYLPVALPGTEVRIPQRLGFLEDLVYQIIDGEQWTGYVYLTARRGYASPGNPLNRPGWHADGFGTDDINYIWADRFPTVFAEHPFHDISDDHVLSAQQFAAQVDAERVVAYPDRTLLRLDPSVIHATPEIPAPGGERSFVKISLSSRKYNLRGNSHNYLFDYEWRMWSRDEIRNDPAYAGGDAGPQGRALVPASTEIEKA